ncbi:hypothetical protein ACIQWA_31280 [Kitasatospora sp. NPDC098652]|uniref:hypothetical protein n=1 Tax=Kitasatospora sp. NPDC098652 TaxID=3364095 RepID=UPI0037FFA6B5
MPRLTDGTLVIVDDMADREEASDGRSRFAAHLTHGFQSDGAPLTAAEFAVASWTTVTGPVRSFAYAVVCPDLVAVVRRQPAPERCLP